MYMEIEDKEKIKIFVAQDVQVLDINIELNEERRTYLVNQLKMLPYNEDFKENTAEDHILGILADIGVVIE